MNIITAEKRGLHMKKTSAKMQSMSINAKDVVNKLGKDIKSFGEGSGKISHEKMMQTLDWGYEKTINGLPGQKTLDEFVNDYLKKYEPELAIDKLISFQTGKAATSGFITGFGGVLTLALTLPANITTVILFQLRMIAAIASIRGYDLNSDQVQTFVYATLAGSSVTDVVKKTGITIGTKMGKSMVQRIPGKALTRINQAVGFRLMTKFGSKGAINLGKMIPVVGASIGGAFDSATTLAIARLAKKTFTVEVLNAGNGIVIPIDSID